MTVNVIFKIAAVGILISVLNQILKHSGRDDQAFLTSLAGLILAVLMMIYPTLIGDVLQAAASPDGTGKYTLDITNYWKASIPIVACSFMYLYALLKSGAWARDILGG